MKTSTGASEVDRWPRASSNRAKEAQATEPLPRTSCSADGIVRRHAEESRGGCSRRAVLALAVAGNSAVGGCRPSAATTFPSELRSSRHVEARSPRPARRARRAGVPAGCRGLPPPSLVLTSATDGGDPRKRARRGSLVSSQPSATETERSPAERSGMRDVATAEPLPQDVGDMALGVGATHTHGPRERVHDARNVQTVFEQAPRQGCHVLNSVSSWCRPEKNTPA